MHNKTPRLHPGEFYYLLPAVISCRQRLFNIQHRLHRAVEFNEFFICAADFVE